MHPDEIRRSYLEFFEERGHEVVKSSPVVPQNDPTLLFTNAGMNQFKDLLLGNETRDYQRATSVQKCIRAGGKHNDLDEVGTDGRHLTFFEMLGNWSFGDYYKRKAIEWAWEYVTEILELEPDRLYATVYKDDDESYDIWTDEIGLADARVLRLGDIEQGDEENFWSMGPTGPCGPCTEIHYDLHPEQGPFDFTPDYDEDRINELWNLVFMEFNRTETGELNPLPMKSVDTGLGLDRAAMILKGVDSVFKTGLFTPIFERTLERLGREETDVEQLFERDEFTNFAVIADHIRSLMFALCDGAQFSNEGRGYVLRRILRRAVRYGRQLGFDEPFLCHIAPALVENYSHVYPELEAMGQEAASLIEIEEKRFFRNIDRGIALFEDAADQAHEEDRSHLTGQEVFKLHATYGFPPDLTEIMAREEGLQIDWNEYERKWEEHQRKSRGDDRYEDAGELGEWETVRESEHSDFVGYETDEVRTHIVQFRHAERDRYDLILEQTPFYAESGGQVGDTGTIELPESGIEFEVDDTREAPIGIIHRARLQAAGDADPTPSTLTAPVRARVDARRRRQTAKNHTATHLLHAALHEIVSESAFQSGSLVAPDRLRFDFSAEDALTEQQIDAIEDWVNDRIREKIPVERHFDVDRDRAVDEMGAMAIFGESYDEKVRVIEIPDKSVELCGGIHVENTSDINLFRITKETSVGAGIRRIEAVTDRAARESFESESKKLHRVADILKTEKEDAVPRARRLVEEKSKLERHVEQLTQKLAHYQTAEMIDNAPRIDGVTVIARKLDLEDRDELLQFADNVRDKTELGVGLFVAEIDDKPAIVVAATESAVEQKGIDANDLIREAAKHVDGSGGGRPTLAQGGGADPEGLGSAVSSFESIVRRQLEAEQA